MAALLRSGAVAAVVLAGVAPPAVQAQLAPTVAEVQAYRGLHAAGVGPRGELGCAGAESREQAAGQHRQKRG